MAEDTKQTSFDYAQEIWNIADYVRGIIRRADYNKLVLPFALLRRLECALEPTRDAVCKALKANEASWGREHDQYCKYSGKAFYNVTPFRLNTLGADDTYDSLMEYINGFSPNAREILLRFKIAEPCKTLQENKMLYEVCRRFSTFDLSPENVSDREMSDIYEHLIARYGDEVAEDAEDFMTPKDVVRLAVGILFANDDELMNSDTGIVRTLYDPTAGTCGFITDAMNQLDEWHKNKRMKAPAMIVPYGQEYADEIWAMGKANLLLRNIGDNAKDVYDSIKDLSVHIAFGDTLSDDKFPDLKFNYQLSNPPYGKKWEAEEDAVKEEAARGFKGRFGAGLPSIDDGAMLFLQHVVSKMLPVSEGGGKAGIVLAGSPLFTGDAGSGTSNIRRWLFKEDVISCIVKLPADIFFRTNINTYLWILNNNKPENRKGLIQLIDASDMRTLRRKNLGKKRYDISADQAAWIIQTYVDGNVNEKSVIVPVEEFMYRKVTTQRPLRAKLIIDQSKMPEFFLLKTIAKLSPVNAAILQKELSKHVEETYTWADEFAKSVRKTMTKPEVQAAQIAKGIRDIFTVKSPNYPCVTNKDGNFVADPELKDSENIPLDVVFDEYMRKEVLPYAPDSWIDETVVDKGTLADGQVGVVGTCISFNKYFYHYEEPRKPADIASEIESLEHDLEAFMKEILR